MSLKAWSDPKGSELNWSLTFYIQRSIYRRSIKCGFVLLKDKSSLNERELLLHSLFMS